MREPTQVEADEAASKLAGELADMLDADPLILIASSRKLGNVVAIVGTTERVQAAMPALLREIANQIEQGVTGTTRTDLTPPERH